MKDQDSLDLASQDVRNLLDAFRLLEPFPLYFIGPYGSRISFQSQQIRALNLVHALANDSKANISGKNIAVIGAGVTGMTVAAGLASHNANVHLYEQKSENEDFIGNCSSRYVHPNINFVPEEALSFTTKLPIMNWHADTADSVIIQLKKQLAHHEKSEKNKTGKISRHYEAVSRISARDYSTNKKLILYIEEKIRSKSKIINAVKDKNADHISSEKREVTHGHFDYVISCTGFSLERKLAPIRKGGRSYEDSPGYWDGANIKSGKKIDTVLIVGAGDGGIIDALDHGIGWNGNVIHQIALKATFHCTSKGDSHEKILDQQLEDYDLSINKKNRLPTILVRKKDNKAKPAEWHSHLLRKTQTIPPGQIPPIEIIESIRSGYDHTNKSIHIEDTEGRTHIYPTCSTLVLVRIGADHASEILTDFVKSYAPTSDIEIFFKEKEAFLSKFQRRIFWGESFYGDKQKKTKPEFLANHATSALRAWEAAYTDTKENIEFTADVTPSISESKKNIYTVKQISGNRIEQLPGLPHIFGVEIKVEYQPEAESGVLETNTWEE